MRLGHISSGIILMVALATSAIAAEQVAGAIEGSMSKSPDACNTNYSIDDLPGVDVECIGHDVQIDFNGQELEAKDVQWAIAETIGNWSKVVDADEVRSTPKTHVLTLANLVVREQLRLDNIRLEPALVLKNVSIATASDSCSGKRSKPHGLVINNIHMRRLEVIDSCLSLLQITNSQLREGVRLYSRSDAPTEKTDIGEILVVKSSFGTEVSLYRTTVGSLFVSRSQLAAVGLTTNEFRHELRLVDNSIASLRSWRDRASAPVVLTGNRIAGTLELQVVEIENSEGLRIRNNDVGGRLFVSLRPNSNGDDTRYHLDLSYNNVRHDSDLWLPLDGQLSKVVLTSSRFDTALRVCYARLHSGSDATDEKMIPVPAQVIRQDPYPVLTAKEMVDPSRMQTEELPLIMHDVQVGAMGWMLPRSAAVVWNADGMRYRHWGVAEEITVSQWKEIQVNPADHTPDHCVDLIDDGGETLADTDRGNSVDGLFALIEAIPDEDNVDTLSNMARYFKEHGANLLHRRSLLEAKKRNYLASIWQFDGTLSAGIQAIVAAFAMLILLPVGLGVFPEFALLLLLIVWIGGYRWYLYYRDRHAEEWRKAWDQIKNVGHNEEGYSLVGGFIQFERDRMPREFDLLIFSADATLPVIDLHVYNTFYPSRQRWVPGVQHVLGWWLLSVFLASVTVL